jgi:hypothetical protein
MTLSVIVFFPLTRLMTQLSNSTFCIAYLLYIAVGEVFLITALTNVLDMYENDDLLSPIH